MTTPTPPHRSLLRGRLRTTTAALAVGTAALLAADVVVPANAEAPGTLAAVATSSGREIGVALGTWKMGDATYTSIADREFSSITPENELTFEAIESVRNTYRFDAADTLVNWATAHGKTVRGWGPLSDVQRPAWVAGLSPALQRQEIMRHLTDVVTRYRGRITSWDVVTEALTETGTVRNSLLPRTGSDWMDVAFATAHAADPDATLCYTDYGIEDWDSPKTQATYRLLKDLLARKIPVGCVGIEAHFTGGNRYPGTFRTTLMKFAELGLQIHLTQLDVTGNSSQASVYGQAVRACLSVWACRSITIWGVRDSDSWRAAESPVLFDGQGRPKPAYSEVLSALVLDDTPTSTTGSTPTSTSPTTTKPVKSTKPPKPKPTRTVCRTKKKDGALTCKTVTRT